MGNSGQTLIEDLEGVLQVERHMIRAGTFDGLEQLAIRKERLLVALEGTSAELLVRVKDLAEANQRLLGAAIKGVRAAQRRLDMIQRASRTLNSYDKLGRARTIGDGGSSVERRA